MYPKNVSDIVAEKSKLPSLGHIYNAKSLHANSLIKLVIFFPIVPGLQLKACHVRGVHALP